MGHSQKPGQLLSHVSTQPPLIGPHSGAGGMAENPWAVLNGGGLLGSADAAVTVQLLPVKPAVGSSELRCGAHSSFLHISDGDACMRTAEPRMRLAGKMCNILMHPVMECLAPALTFKAP